MKGETEKDKTLVDKSPSTIGEPYVHLKLFCVCCKRKFFEGDVREDPDKITGKEKPLCPNCAEHGKLREKLFDEERLELKQKLHQTFESYINAYPLNNKVDAEVRKVLHKMWEELLKEEKEAQSKEEQEKEIFVKCPYCGEKFYATEFKEKEKAKPT